MGGAYSRGSPVDHKPGPEPATAGSTERHSDVSTRQAEDEYGGQPVQQTILSVT